MLLQAVAARPFLFSEWSGNMVTLIFSPQGLCIIFSFVWRFISGFSFRILWARRLMICFPGTFLTKTIQKVGVLSQLRVILVWIWKFLAPFLAGWAGFLSFAIIGFLDGGHSIGRFGVFGIMGF
jgi:hypothetical protein